MVALANCKKGYNMYSNIGEHCDRLKAMPFWKRYAELAGEPQFGSIFGRALVNFTKEEVLECFELFVQDTLVSIPDIAEGGRNGVEPLLHHVRTQLYFLSLRMSMPRMCTNHKFNHICNPRYNFVGKLEDMEDHFTAMMEHYAPRIPDLAPVAAAWAQKSAMRDFAARDSQPERFVDRGGKLFEVTLVASVRCFCGSFDLDLFSNHRTPCRLLR
jgi:hypothetical protein